MATIQDRPFSKNYSGLINQSVIAGCLAVLCVGFHEVMKRRRRGYIQGDGLGSVESWEFGYLYQGRSWAKKPSPAIPLGWPLSWIPEVVMFPESKMNELRGVDATLYVRFMRGCTWFAFLHTLTTVPILLPIHVHFSGSGVSPRSMTRASISSLVGTSTGKNLLWIHLVLLFWITLTWMATLIWICRGAFALRAAKIQEAAERAATDAQNEKYSQWHPHPHPQYPFQDLPSLDYDKSNRGLRLRTVMVTNIPQSLRSEKELGDYFRYYLSRPIDKPSMGLTSSVQPGFFNKSAAFIFNRAKRIPELLPRAQTPTELEPSRSSAEKEQDNAPVIDRVVIARKMTELASLLERREEVLRRLETAHIKLARKTLAAVKDAIDKREQGRPLTKRTNSAMSLNILSPKSGRASPGPDRPEFRNDEADMELLIRRLQPYVDEFCSSEPVSRTWMSRLPGPFSWFSPLVAQYATIPDPDRRSLWEVMHKLPRHTLDPFQPLVYLSALFRNKTVPSIDYYAAKLELLTSLINENRAKPVTEYDPVSTAFVTFKAPKDARRACKYLAVHPNNPLACLVTMAPSYEDLDWTRVMKSSYRAEFVKDWAVNIGVWAFTLFWVFPVSLFVGLVSIQNISAFWPGLARYLQNHEWEEELIQSLVPTLLVALLTLLIPLILILVAKKAHTILTLSTMHDRILTRYYKFLIVNVLVFFCVGTAALQALLVSFASNTQHRNVLEIVSDSFPSAGPFYVGWLIFTTGIHAAIELMLFGLPLFVYPATQQQVTPRKRAVGIRPRTFNFWYWIPNHLLVIHVILVFSVLNPLVIAFGWVYFAVDSAVVKNQLLHVYAKNYEGNGQHILVRIVRYSLDGLILSQGVFLAYMAVLQKKTHVGLTAILIIFTVFVKIFMTRVCRAKHERDDILEANIVCGVVDHDAPNDDEPSGSGSSDDRRTEDLVSDDGKTPLSWPSKVGKAHRFPSRFSFSYTNFPHRAHHVPRRQPNPFPQQRETSFTRLSSIEGPSQPPRPNVDEIVADQKEPGPSHIQIQPELPRHDSRQTRGSMPPIVSPHPPHPAWDDDSDVNQPYDNPYYSRPISSSLWLPRNPCGILNLDDTVDVRGLLTTLPPEQPPPAMITAGPIQEEPMTFAASDTPETTTPSSILQRYLNGTEEISLPVRIASRLDALSQDDVEVAHEHRKTRFRSRLNSGRNTLGTTPGTSGLYRPNTIDAGASHRRQHRTTSFGSSVRTPHYASSMTFLPAARRGRSRSASIDPESGLRPDMHAQAAFASFAMSPVPAGNPSRLTLASGMPVGEPNVVTTQEAVAEEVIVEEQAAAEDRLRKEEAEARRATQHRSWLTRWLFARLD